MKDLLKTYSATTRQKYATMIHMCIDYLNLKTDVHTEYEQNTTVLVLEHKHLMLDLDLQKEPNTK